MSAATSCHSSSQLSTNSGDAGTSASNSSQSSRRIGSSASVARRTLTPPASRHRLAPTSTASLSALCSASSLMSRPPAARQQVVRDEILERVEALSDRSHVDLTIEGGHRLAQAEVAGRPGSRPGEMPGEEPVGSPLAEASLRGDPLLHLLVGQVGERGEVEVGPGERDDVLRLPSREADGDDLFLAGAGEPLARREGVRVLRPFAEPLDQAVADREGGEERDLLRGNRADERLEGIRRERRPEPGDPAGEAPYDLVGRARPGREGAEVERRRRAASGPRSRSPRRAARLRAARGGRSAGPSARLDPHLPPGDHPVEPALVPQVREVRPEGAEALGRDVEVVRLRKAQQQSRAGRRTTRTRRPARPGTPRGPGGRRPGRQRGPRSGRRSRRRRRRARRPPA